ncbi:hypothetical protein HMPREF9419_2421, partial [Prevotella nigrescens ATCC 33563]
RICTTLITPNLFCSDSNSLILIYKLLAMYVVSAKRYQQCLCKETVR